MTKTAVALALSTIALGGVAATASAATETLDSNASATFIPGSSTGGGPGGGGGTGGPLAIDFASNWQFGELEIASQDTAYHAHPEIGEDGEPTPLYVQVTDVRGSFAGWTLSLTQSEQFKDEEGNEMIGAALSFNGTGTTTSTSSAPASVLPSAKGFTLTPGNKQTLLAAKVDEGTGINTYAFGAIEDYDTTATDGKQAANQGPVDLNVTAGSMRVGAYTTSLVWTLEDTPAS